MKKILFAIDNQKAERKLSELIKDASAKEEYQVVGTPVSNESVLDFLQNKTADILVYMEGLSGKEDSFDFVLKLHKRYPHLRIVFIAGQREIGDKKLATLVAFHIYDIIAGQKILMPDVAKRILNPAVFEDVVHYLPDDGNDVFKDTDFNRSVTAKEAQNETDRIAEKASAHKQILDAKNNAKTLALKLDAAEAKARMLEDEKANWEIAAGKERMLLERKFDEDRKILCAQIDDLNRKIQNLEQEKSDIETQCRKLEQQLDAVSKNLESSQKQSSATIKALQIEREGLVEKYDNIIRQHDACQRELDSLKQKIKQQKDDILSDAQKEADKIIVAAPYWDFSFPSLLKVFFEKTADTGITFCYTENGSVGYCKADHLVYLSTAGGYIAGAHLGAEYVRNLVGMFGVNNVSGYSIEGLDIDPSKREQLLEEGIIRILSAAKL